MGCHSYTSEAPQTFLHTVVLTFKQPITTSNKLYAFICLFDSNFIPRGLLQSSATSPPFKQHGHDIHHSFMCKTVQFTLKLAIDMSISSGRATSERSALLPQPSPSSPGHQLQSPLQPPPSPRTAALGGRDCSRWLSLCDKDGQVSKPEKNLISQL